MISLTLPYPPSLNHLYATVRGRRVLSEEGRQYKKDVFLDACQQGAARNMLTGDVWVTLHFYRPRKAGDLDNLLKATLDALTGICWKDDKQIVSIEACRFEDKDKPRVWLWARTHPAPGIERPLAPSAHGSDSPVLPQEQAPE